MKNEKTLLFNVNKKGHARDNPDLLRIILSPNFTKIDFGYTAKEVYVNGGWIRIAPETFIEIRETQKRFVLDRTEGIPISPEHHYFESKKEWRYFSLYFPSIPQTNCNMNIIEIENGSTNDFNYHNITLDMKEGIEVNPLNNV